MSKYADDQVYDVETGLKCSQQSKKTQNNKQQSKILTEKEKKEAIDKFGKIFEKKQETPFNTFFDNPILGANFGTQTKGIASDQQIEKARNARIINEMAEKNSKKQENDIMEKMAAEAERRKREQIRREQEETAKYERQMKEIQQQEYLAEQQQTQNTSVSGFSVCVYESITQPINNAPEQTDILEIFENLETLINYCELNKYEQLYTYFKQMFDSLSFLFENDMMVNDNIMLATNQINCALERHNLLFNFINDINECKIFINEVSSLIRCCVSYGLIEYNVKQLNEDNLQVKEIFDEINNINMAHKSIKLGNLIIGRVNYYRQFIGELKKVFSENTHIVQKLIYEDSNMRTIIEKLIYNPVNQ